MCSVKRTIVLNHEEVKDTDEEDVDVNGDAIKENDGDQSSKSTADKHADSFQEHAISCAVVNPDDSAACAPLDPTQPTTAAQDFAARAVQKAYREWREMRIQFIKGLNWKPSLHVNVEADNFDDNPQSGGAV